MSLVGRWRTLASSLWTRLFRPKRVALGAVVVHLDPRRMPVSLMRAVIRGDYELPERLAVERMVRPGDRVAEFGGGVGVISMTAARIAGPGAVHVFEPQPAACALIRWNAGLNGLAIDCRNLAVARSAGRCAFYADSNIISSNLLGNRRRKGEVATIEVEAAAIDDIMAELHPNVLIVDIEGAEVEVLGDRDLSGVEVIIIELHPRAVGEEAIARLQAYFVAQGLAPVPELDGLDTRVFSRSRVPSAR